MPVAVTEVLPTVNGEGIVTVPLKVGLVNMVDLLSLVTLFKARAVLKFTSLKADTVLSALTRRKVMALGLVRVNRLLPTVVPPRLVRPVAGTRFVALPSHCRRSVYAVFQFVELFVIGVPHPVPVESGIPAPG